MILTINLRALLSVIVEFILHTNVKEIEEVSVSVEFK